MKLLLITALFSGTTFVLAQNLVTQKNNPTLIQRINESVLLSHGSEGVGGGHIVSCKGHSSVTLDYYNALVRAQHQNLLLDPESNDFEKILIQRLNGFQLDYDDLELFENLKIGNWLEQTLHSIGEVSSWTRVDLKIIEDHNLIYNLPPACILEQAAAQERNGNNIEMYQNLSNTNKLSSGQKKILRVHEAFYTLVRRQLGVNSKPVRKFLEKILLKKISNDERDRAIKNFIAEIKLSARKYICQATAYTPLFKGSSKFYKKDTQQLIFYGQTIQEAFHKLLDAQITTGFIPCNAVGDSGNAITGICLKPLTLGENCK